MMRYPLIKLPLMYAFHFQMQSICIECYQQELQVDYTMSPRIHQNPYHVPVTRTQLTRNVGMLYSELRNEITTAFDDIIDLKGNGEWAFWFGFCINGL